MSCYGKTLYKSTATFFVILATFYRAMLCIRGTSYEPVSVSVCHKCSIETVERIELVFGMRASFHPVLHCVKRKFGYLQK